MFPSESPLMAISRYLKRVQYVTAKLKVNWKASKMKTNNYQRSSNNLECIWMTSELVKYKLCDKELDCENCEFDKVFRNLSKKINDKNDNGDPASAGQNGDLVGRLIKRIENENFDNRVIYLKNQLVIKNLFGSAFYLGINPIILYMLDEFNSIHEYNNNIIKRDQIIFTIEGQWGIKQFISPINFMIIEKINFSKFKLNRWHSIILFDELDKENFQISNEEWNDEKNKSLSILRDYKNNKLNAGETLMDGGEKVKYLYQFLGSREYLKLLSGVFQ